MSLTCVTWWTAVAVERVLRRNARVAAAAAGLVRLVVIMSVTTD
jgi:hypothetical protein